MILYNNNIVVPEYMGSMVSRWMTLGRACDEPGGRLYNYDGIPNELEVASAGGVFNYELGLTMPTKCVSSSSSWLTGYFNTGQQMAAAVSASQLIRNGKLGTGQAPSAVGQSSPGFKYLGMGLQIGITTNTTASERRGTLRFQPNGWATSEFSSSDYLPAVGLAGAFTITVIQKAPEVGPPSDPGRISFTFELDGINGVEATISYGTKTFRLTGSAAGGPETVAWNVPQPHIVETYAGANTIDVLDLRTYYNGMEHTGGNYTISPSSQVSVPSNGTVSVTITFSA